MKKDFPWFRFCPDAVLAETADLNASELGVYSHICMRIMSCGRPIPSDSDTLSRRVHVQERTFIKALERLISLGLVELSDGHIFIEWCLKEIDWRKKYSESKSYSSRSRRNFTEKSLTKNNGEDAMPIIDSSSPGYLIRRNQKEKKEYEGKGHTNGPIPIGNFVWPSKDR